MTYTKFINPKLITVSALTGSLFFTSTIANANETSHDNSEITDKNTSENLQNSNSVINAKTWSLTQQQSSNETAHDDQKSTSTESSFVNSTESSLNTLNTDSTSTTQSKQYQKNTSTRDQQTNLSNVNSASSLGSNSAYETAPRAPRRAPHHINKYHQQVNLKHVNKAKINAKQRLNNRHRIIPTHNRFSFVIDNKIQWLVNQRKNRKLGNQQMITLLSEKANRSGLTATISDYY